MFNDSGHFYFTYKLIFKYLTTKIRSFTIDPGLRFASDKLGKC